MTPTRRTSRSAAATSQIPDALVARAAAAQRAARSGIEAIHPALALGALAAVQLAVVAVIALRAQHNGWLWSAPGTDDWTAAWALGHLWVPAGPASFGQPVLAWPLALIAGGSLTAALPVVVVLQAAIAGPLVLLALYGIAARIGGRVFGYLAALAWAIAPLFALAYFYGGHGEFEGIVYENYRGDIHDIVMPNALGLTIDAAFLSLVALTAAAWLLVRSLDSGEWNDVLLAGLVTGFALGVDPANVVFLPAPVLALLVARRPRRILGFAAALIPALVTLALWRWTASGHLSGFGHPRFIRETFRLDLVNLKAVGWSVLLVEWIAVAGTFAIVRKSPAKGVLVAVWFLGFFLTAPGRANVRGTAVFRLLEPGFPAFVLLAAAIFLLVPTWGRRRVVRAPANRRPHVTPVLAAAVGLLGLYPLTIVALTSRAPDGHVFRPAHGQSVPVVGSLGVHAESGALAWKSPSAGGTALSYGIYRDSGAPATIVRGTTGPVAGPGSYRVGVLADRDPNVVGGELLLISPVVSAP